MLELQLGVCSIYFLWYTRPEYMYAKKYPTNISLQLHYRDRNMSTVENYPIYSFKNTFLKYFWICITLMTLIRIFSVGFNGNNTINYFTKMVFKF